MFAEDVTAWNGAGEVEGGVFFCADVADRGRIEGEHRCVVVVVVVAVVVAVVDAYDFAWDRRYIRYALCWRRG